MVELENQFTRKAFGQRLSLLMGDMGFVGTDLARRLGVYPSTVSRYQSGEGWPRIELLIKLAYELDTTLDYLLLGDYHGKKKATRNNWRASALKRCIRENTYRKRK